MTGRKARSLGGRAFLLLVVPAILAAGACSDDGRDLADAPATTSTSTTVAAAMGTAPGVADLPVPLEAPAHGSAVWAVYLATGAAGDAPAIEDAVHDAEEHGYSATVGQASCDAGASDALGITPDSFVVALYFDSEDDARRFAAGYEPSPVGVTKIQVMCAD